MINKNELLLNLCNATTFWYSIEPRTRYYAKGYGFLSFARKYKKQLLDTVLDAVKTGSEKVVHKADKIVKKKPVEQIIIPPGKKNEILNKLRQVLL